MSFLSALSELAGQQSMVPTEQHASVAQAFVQQAQQSPGGLSSILDQFRQNGMNQHVNSWLGPQPNQPIEGHQVEQAMGGGAIDAIAQRAGISPALTKTALAVVLPMLISHLSQGTGQLPQQATSGGGLASMAESLFARAI